MRLFTVLFVAVPGLSYSTTASDSLLQLATSINQTTDYINHLEGCGYLSTTQAISQDAPVSDGSACATADAAISTRLSSVSRGIQTTLGQLKSSRSSTQVTSTQIVSDFNSFASAYYALFNAMDLAECTYILTTSSQSFGAQFTNSGAASNLKDGWNAIISELSSNILVGAQIAGTNLKQQTHFGGTSFLATQVGGPDPIALAGCELITSIVQSEGGGSS